MSIFKNTVTGDVTTVFGPIHDHYATRSDEELIFDDRDALRDFTTEGLDVKPEPDPEPELAPKSAGNKSVSQDITPSDADGVDNPKE